MPPTFEETRQASRFTTDQTAHLVDLVRRKVRRFLGVERRRDHDREDLEQDVLLRLIERFDAYDPARACPATFFDRVINSALVDNCRHSHAAKRDCARVERSLNDEIFTADGRRTEFGQTLSDEQYELGRGRLVNAVTLDLMLDVSEALGQLPPTYGEFCQELMNLSVAEAAHQAGVARGTGYRWLKTVRQRFQDSSLRDYLENPRDSSKA